MPRRLRQVTVTLEEEVARRARLEAARQETSVSQFLGRILKERMLQQDAHEQAMRRTLKRKPFLNSKSRYLSREELHDRFRLR